MKNGFNYTKRLWITLLCVGLFSACNDNSTPTNQLAGSWSLQAIATNNTLLNQLLETLLPSIPLPLNSIVLNFGEDKNLIISYPTAEGEKTLQAAYAYNDTELALRFDGILPIPFNAFGIQELTDSKLILTQTLSKKEVETLIQLIIKQNPPYETVLTAIATQIEENGLKADLIFAKK